MAWYQIPLSMALKLRVIFWLRKIIKVFYFCDSDMILLWFCYGFDMVENMVFLWSETIS